MAKTQEELNELKQEYEIVTSKLHELTEDELKYVTGGELTPSPVNVNGSEIVKRAESCLGKPYVWGAVGPDGYDNSGLVSYCISGAHLRIGTCSTFMGWSRVSDPTPGDICVSAYHCGIFVGGGQMIHAPGFGQSVCCSGIQSDMIIVRP